MNQPYTASGRLTLLVTPLTRVRKIRVPVQLVLPLANPVTFVIRNPSGGNVGGAVAAQALWNLLIGYYPASVPAASYLIEQNFSGVFVPVQSGALSTAGNASGGSQNSWVETYTFRSTIGHKLKILLPETVAGVLTHQSLSGLGTVPLAFVNNMLAFTNTGDLGNWIVSRGGEIIKSFTFRTISPNKRYRRQAGLT